MAEMKKALSPINNESVVQQIINKITEAIIAGELKPGERLPPEMELIETLQVSRNSLRAALQALRSIGVLEVRRPEGTFVSNNFTPQMINPMLYKIILHQEDSYKDLIGLRELIDMPSWSRNFSRRITALNGLPRRICACTRPLRKPPAIPWL